MSSNVLFLDDASQHPGPIERSEAEKSVKQLISVLRKVRKINAALALNAAVPISQFKISEEWSISAIFVGNQFKEEWAFIRLLLDRSPLSKGVEEFLNSVVTTDYFTKASHIKSIALAWAAVLETAIVSLNGQSDWNEPWVETVFDELDDRAEIVGGESQVRNFSAVDHVNIHADWLSTLGHQPLPKSAAEIWEQRAERYPKLRFLPRVKRDLLDLENTGAPYTQALIALENISKDAENWPSDEEWPKFSTRATGEGETRSKFCWVDDEITGYAELFDWHTRFTGAFAGRLHFRVDAKTRTIVVAYIGIKLSAAIQEKNQLKRSN